MSARLMVLYHQRLVSISSSGLNFDWTAKKAGGVIGSLPLRPEYRKCIQHPTAVFALAGRHAIGS